MGITNKTQYSAKDLVWPTFEAIVLNAVSGVLAQLVQYISKEKDVFAFDHVSILQFVLFTAIVTAPNYLFQRWLEDTWPSRTTATRKSKETDKPAEEQVINVGNTVKKFLLDQSISATANTLLFFVLLGAIKGKNFEYIKRDVVDNFWTLLFAGYRFWPFVCITNLVFVPFQLRGLLGSLAGLGWGVFLSLRTS